MKKLLIVVIACLMMLGLSACDGDGDGSRTDEKAVEIEFVL